MKTRTCVRTSVTLPKDLWVEVKYMAAYHQMTLSSAVAAFLKLGMAHERQYGALKSGEAGVDETHQAIVRRFEQIEDAS